MIELLSPVGNFECLKAAVQNGASAVYFGASSFNARAYASNFDSESLNETINYAKLRNVKTHLTLNTLIKESEFDEAIKLAQTAYEYGIDAIIVQDLGLASKLIDLFPDLEIHASTQMTVHNLDGVKAAEQLGFKRVVLSRELSIPEIKNICENSNIEIECFAHGALCISYSGQCLFSSIVGGRSGNRGKCAQPCRLQYELMNSNNHTIDKGYLLSPKDLCSLKYLPQLIKAGVSSLKIEGRMKSPEYVAAVTRIYRKYIDLAYKYIEGTIPSYDVLDSDIYELMQVFNRGGFSSGHLLKHENKDLIYKESPRNIGVYLGNVIKFVSQKGLVTCKLVSPVSISDSISFEKENTKYTISELMDKSLSNIKLADKNDIVTFGRMKGNIHINDKIYKISSNNLSKILLESYSHDTIKNILNCNIEIKKDKNILINIECINHNQKVNFEYNYIPQNSKNAPITKEDIINQFNKTQNTCFKFNNININLDDNLFIPISIINDIRRTSISYIENTIIKSFKRKYTNTESKTKVTKRVNSPLNCTIIDYLSVIKSPSISLLLNSISLDEDYNIMQNIDRLYIPLKYFDNQLYTKLLKDLSLKFKIYIYMPSIIRDTNKFTVNKLNDIITNFNIKGLVISNLSQLEILKDLNKTDLDKVANYTLNLYNSESLDILKNSGINCMTISPELDKESIVNLCNNSTTNKELIVYGKLPLMTTNYCPIGKSNKCYQNCKHYCMDNNKYYLKDRLGINFRIIPDNGITTIYNSKITSIDYSYFNINSVRIDILDESVNEINHIIDSVKNNTKLEGKEYTNGNLNKSI